MNGRVVRLRKSNSSNAVSGVELSNTVQHPAWAKAVFSALLPVPFYFLELLVGLVQAFVFMLLTTVFTALICTHDEAHPKEAH